MADFYPVLSRAIAGLADKSAPARRAVYDKAKTVLVAQLRGVNPPLPESEIMRQRLALDDVIARIERDYASVDEPSPDLAPPPKLPPLPEPAPMPAESKPAPRPAEIAPEPEPPSQWEAAAPVAEPAQPDRPKLGIAAPKARRPVPWRGALAAGAVAVVIGAIALTAMTLNRDGPSPLQPQPGAPPAAPQQPGGPKISERVGAEATQPAQTPAQPPAQAGRGDVAVAQRAVLYVEPADQTQAPRALNGRVSWRVEAQNPGRGQPLETVVRADIDIAEGGLSLTFTIRRNADAALPASHIIGMRFQRTSDDGNGAVREAGVPQLKTEENERGAPLSAINSILGENLFVSALSRVPVELERNLELLRTRNWIDIPIRFASGRRGIIAFEKGVSGDQRIAEGLRAWQ